MGVEELFSCCGTSYYEQKGGEKRAKGKHENQGRAKDKRDKDLIGSHVSSRVLWVILRS